MSPNPVLKSIQNGNELSKKGTTSEKPRVLQTISVSRKLGTVIRDVRRGLLLGLAHEIGYARWVVYTRAGRRLPVYAERTAHSGRLDY